MWEKLLGLLKNSTEDKNYIPASIAKREARKQELANINQQSVIPNSEIKSQPGEGTLIGFDYLKGLRDEDNSKQLRRFINLNKLLRGKYSGKIEADTTESQSDIRRENSE